MDIRYAAGFIDGDGSILATSTAPHGRSKSPSLNVFVYACGSKSNAIAPFLEFGGSVQKNIDKRNPEWAPMYSWSLSQGKDSSFLKALLPHLIVKREQAEVAIQLGARKAAWPRQNLMLTGEEIALRENLRAKVVALNDNPNRPCVGEISDAYAAGFFDAEGSIRIFEQSSRAVASVSATNNCRSILDLLAERFGGGVRRGKDRNWRWEVKRKAAYRFLEDVGPYLVVLRERAHFAQSLIGSEGDSAKRLFFINESKRMNLKGLRAA